MVLVLYPSYLFFFFRCYPGRLGTTAKPSFFVQRAHLSAATVILVPSCMLSAIKIFGS